jgi:hypothetical protein
MVAQRLKQFDFPGGERFDRVALCGGSLGGLDHRRVIPESILA